MDYFLNLIMDDHFISAVRVLISFCVGLAWEIK